MPGQRSKLRWVIWGLGALFYFYELILRTSPTVMVDELMLTFGVDAALLGSLSAFYFYAYAPMQLPAGILMDRFGVRRLLTLAILLCGLGGLLFGLAHILAVAEGGRLLTGVGSSFAFVGMVYICAHWFEPGKRALLIGLGNSIGMLGSFFGEGPLAIAVDHFGWRGPSITLGIVGIALAILCYFTIRGTPLTQTTIRSDTFKKLWNNLKIVASNPHSWVNALIASCIFITTSVFAGLWADPFLQAIHNLSKETASFASSMVFIGWIVGGPLLGIITDKIGRCKPILIFSIIATAACLIPVLYLPVLSTSLIFTLLFLVGVFSTGQLLSFSIAIEINPLIAKGTAAALTNTVIAFFAAALQPLVGLFLDISGDYRIAFTCFPTALLIAFLLSFILKEKRRA